MLEDGGHEGRSAYSHTMFQPRIWRCPECGGVPLGDAPEGLSCPSCNAFYPMAFGTPVLIHADNGVFPRQQYAGARPTTRPRSRLAELVPNPSANLSYERVMSHLVELLADEERPAILIVGSGGQRREVERRLEAQAHDIEVIAVDVDAAADVDAFCDAHDLPFPDSSVDAVLATAVLEHVFDPVRVVAEIHRVLRPRGLVYTELPFMQQVHEGAYDFTRFTLSGHRRLMRHFDELESGPVAGPGTALAWALEHFMVALLPRRMTLVARAVTRLLLGWLKHVDRLVAERPAALDAASCTYFFGRRRNGPPIDDAEIISGYRGAQRVTHV